MGSAPSTPHVFGCRSPQSKGSGFWDGAYVYASRGGTAVGAMFENSMDYVGHPSLAEAVATYDRLIAKGWTPMGPEDLTKTSGVEIGRDTILTPGI
jgi:hypothetical protein